MSTQAPQLSPAQALKRFGNDEHAWTDFVLNEFRTKDPAFRAIEESNQRPTWADDKRFVFGMAKNRVFTTWEAEKQFHDLVELFWDHAFWQSRIRPRVINNNRPLTKRRWFRNLSHKRQIEVATDLLRTHLSPKRKTLRFGTPARYESILVAIEEILPEIDREPWRQRVRELLSNWEAHLVKTGYFQPNWRKIFRSLPDQLAHTPNAALLAKAL